MRKSQRHGGAVPTLRDARVDCMDGWDDTVLEQEVTAPELVAALMARLNTMRYYLERTRRRLSRMPTVPTDKASDPFREGWCRSAREEEEEERTQILSTLAHRFGTLPASFGSRGPPPLLNPSVFAAALRVLGRASAAGGNMEKDDADGAGADGCPAPVRVRQVAMQLLCLLPEVGHDDVVSDALLHGQARRCASRQAAAECGVYLMPHEREVDDTEEDGEEDEEKGMHPGGTRDASAKGDEGTDGDGNDSGSVSGQEEVRRAQHRHTRRRQRDEGLLLHYGSPTHTHELMEALRQVAAAGTEGCRERFTALRVLLTLPSVRETFAQWHAVRAGQHDADAALVHMCSADVLWGDTLGSAAPLTAVVWEALLCLIPDPMRELWSPSTFLMWLRLFGPLVRAITAGDRAPSTPPAGATAALAPEQRRQQRLRRQSTARWYAFVVLQRLVSAAARLGVSTSAFAIAGGTANGVDALFAQTVLTSPAIAACCLEVLSNSVAHGHDAAEVGGAANVCSQSCARPPVKAATTALSLFRTVAAPALAGSRQAASSTSTVDIACDILTSLAHHAATGGDSSAHEGAGMGTGVASSSGLSLLHTCARAHGLAVPSAAMVRDLLLTNRSAVLAVMDARDARRRKRGTAASETTSDVSASDGDAGNGDRNGPVAAPVSVGQVSEAAPAQGTALRDALWRLGPVDSSAGTE